MPSASTTRQRQTRTFSELLSGYPPTVQSLARLARELVRGLLPEAEQTVDAKKPFVAYRFGPGYKGIVCVLSVSQAGVKLTLAQGATLPDPSGLLEGAGRVHRHIVFKTAHDLRQPGVKALVAAAYRTWRERR